MEKLIIKEYHLQTIDLSRELLENMELLQLKISLMKSTLLALTLKKPTTFCGHLNFGDQEVDFLKKDILSKEGEIGEIERTL